MKKILTTQRELQNTKHAPGLSFRCGQCGKVKPVQTNGGTGYGYKHHDKPEQPPICYDCCGINDRESMKATGRAVLYLTGSVNPTGEVSNWPGTLRFRAHVRQGRHNIARYRYDVWFTGPDGFRWHGVTIGDNTQICRCKRTKEMAAV